MHFDLFKNLDSEIVVNCIIVFRSGPRSANSASSQSVIIHRTDHRGRGLIVCTP